MYQNRALLKMEIIQDIGLELFREWHSFGRLNVKS